MRATTMGMSEIPGYVPPWVSGGGGSGGTRVIEPIDPLGSGGDPDVYGFYNQPTPSAAGPGPQTMAEALGNSPAPMPVDDGSLKINIDQQTLLIGLAVAAGLLFFATR